MLQARCPYLNLPINDDKYQLISFQSFQTSRHVCFAVDIKIGKVCFLSTKIGFLNTDYCICLVCVMAVWRDVPCMFVTPVFVPRYFPSRPGSCRWTIQYFQSDESAPADMYVVFVMEVVSVAPNPPWQPCRGKQNAAS